jgi:predicted MFS family arabinose efflux permease
VLVAALVVNFVAFAPLTYTSIWLQGVENISAIGVGLSTLPLAGAAFLVSWQAGRVLHRLPPGRVIAAGLAFVALGSFINAALLHGAATWPALMAGFTLIGAGTGLAVPTLTAAAMSSVPPDRGGIASGTVNTARQLGFAIGIALLGAAFTAGAAASLTTGTVPDADAAATALSAGQAANLIGDAGASSDTLLAALHDAALAGLDRLFLLAGGLALAAALAVTVLVRTGRGGATPTPADATDAEPAAR